MENSREEVSRDPGTSRLPEDIINAAGAAGDQICPEDQDMELEDGDESVSESLLDSNDEDTPDPTPALLPTSMPPPPPPQPPVLPRDESAHVPVKKARELSISSCLKKTRIRSTTDDVFYEEGNHSAGGPSSVKSFGGVLRSMGEKRTAHSSDGPSSGFPPVYNFVRANKNRAMAGMQLDSGTPYSRTGGGGEEGPKLGGGFLAEGDQRGLGVLN